MNDISASCKTIEMTLAGIVEGTMVHATPVSEFTWISHGKTGFSRIVIQET
jgi:hypothetical protein